uniref:Putative tick transposon n=1 Tax=Ixodes ricinus TaxID=34613 RepID=A0A6B0UY39_IXORI
MLIKNVLLLLLLLYIAYYMIQTIFPRISSKDDCPFACSFLRYSITVFGSSSECWKTKVDCILKAIVKNVSYKLEIPDHSNLFDYLQLPDFRTLYAHSVVLRHFRNSKFNISSLPSQYLRHTHPFHIPLPRARYGKCRRAFFVPHRLAHFPPELPSQTSLSKVKRMLRGILFH